MFRRLLFPSLLFHSVFVIIVLLFCFVKYRMWKLLGYVDLFFVEIICTVVSFYGIITSQTSRTLKMLRGLENDWITILRHIPPPPLLWYNMRRAYYTGCPGFSSGTSPDNRSLWTIISWKVLLLWYNMHKIYDIAISELPVQNKAKLLKLMDNNAAIKTLF